VTHSSKTDRFLLGRIAFRYFDRTASKQVSLDKLPYLTTAAQAQWAEMTTVAAMT
jgi:hypothetical protein